MTVVAEPLIKPFNLPQQCSSCFNQDTSLRHIDFQAACDRGWYGQDPATHISMDDLILCESCIGEAARQLGWMPTSEVMEKIDSLEHRLAKETKRADSGWEYADRMEDALKHRPGGEVLDHRRRPRGRSKRSEED
jgi:hypothetical protein